MGNKSASHGGSSIELSDCLNSMLRSQTQNYFQRYEIILTMDIKETELNIIAAKGTDWGLCNIIKQITSSYKAYLDET